MSRQFQYPIVSEITTPRHKITRDTFLDNLNQIVLPETAQLMGQLVLFPVVERPTNCGSFETTVIDLDAYREQAAQEPPPLIA